MIHLISIPKQVRYFLNLGREENERKHFMFKRKPLIYCIRCLVTNQVYIGSSLTRHNQMFTHLITKLYSNLNLQAAINDYGMQ